MLGSPPLPQPEGQRVVRVRRTAQKRFCVGWVFFLRRVFQKKRRDAGRRQRRVLFRVVWVFVLCAVAFGLTVVMVLMVAMAFCAALLRVMLEGRSEQVAYWPGVMGVQLRTTSPL